MIEEINSFLYFLKNFNNQETKYMSEKHFNKMNQLTLETYFLNKNVNFNEHESNLSENSLYFFLRTLYKDIEKYTQSNEIENTLLKNTIKVIASKYNFLKKIISLEINNKFCLPEDKKEILCCLSFIDNSDSYIDSKFKQNADELIQLECSKIYIPNLNEDSCEKNIKEIFLNNSQINFKEYNENHHKQALLNKKLKQAYFPIQMANHNDIISSQIKEIKQQIEDFKSNTNELNKKRKLNQFEYLKKDEIINEKLNKVFKDIKNLTELFFKKELELKKISKYKTK